jgi:hypothetical protein
LRRATLLATAVLTLAACGGTSESIPEGARVSTATEPSGLVFRRADGSEIEMAGRPLVWCGPWNDMIPNRALQVAAIGGVRREPGQHWFSYWQLWAIPGDVQGRKPVGFPSEYTFERPRGVVLFVGDAETENEASTEGDDSGGQVVFSQAGCEVGAPIEFTIDALADSEFGDGDPVSVKGTFRGVVAEPPAGWYG